MQMLSRANAEHVDRRLHRHQGGDAVFVQVAANGNLHFYCVSAAGVGSDA